jgi:hypothetical protein
VFIRRKHLGAYIEAAQEQQDKTGYYDYGHGAHVGLPYYVNHVTGISRIRKKSGKAIRLDASQAGAHNPCRLA